MPKRAYSGFSQIETDLLTKKSLKVGTFGSGLDFITNREDNKHEF